MQMLYTSFWQDALAALALLLLFVVLALVF